jgi:hypothetical protein
MVEGEPPRNPDAFESHTLSVWRGHIGIFVLQPGGALRAVYLARPLRSRILVTADNVLISDHDDLEDLVRRAIGMPTLVVRSLRPAGSTKKHIDLILPVAHRCGTVERAVLASAIDEASIPLTVATGQRPP